MTDPRTFPAVATRIRIDTGCAEATNSPTSTASDCIGRIVAATKAELKRPIYAIMFQSLPTVGILECVEFFEMRDGFSPDMVNAVRAIYSE